MEVTTSLAVVSVALISILALLPLAVEMTRTSARETRGAQLARMVASTLASEPYNAAPCFSSTLPVLDFEVLDEDSEHIFIYADYVPSKVGTDRDSVSPPIRVERSIAPPPPSSLSVLRVELSFQAMRYNTDKRRLELSANANKSYPLAGTQVRYKITSHPRGELCYDGSEFIRRRPLAQPTPRP